MKNEINRRQLFAAAAGAFVAPFLVGVSDAPAQPRTAMGIASNAWDVHFEVKRLEPLAFLEQCHDLGLAGMQLPLGVRDAEYCATLGARAEQLGMYIEASIGLIGNVSLESFERQLQSAKAAGVQVVRTVVFPGRRYEVFKSADEFDRASKRALENLQRVEPVMAKHRMRLAIENHKDQRIPERLEMLKRLSSEWIGVCVDVGNSFALCEDPLEVVRAYAPFAFSVHIKDQSARECPEGFLYADMPLGKGFLDLTAMVQVLRQAHPEVRFNYEVITRDPLLVSVLTPKYWASMPAAPASDLARTLRAVKLTASKEPFPSLNGIPVEQQVELETRNIRDSLIYAQERLGI